MSPPYPILLMTHGGWGEALLESARLVAGELPAVYPLPLAEGQSLEAYKAGAEALLAELGTREAVFAADLLGGSPYYAAAELGRKFASPALSGLSLELLLALCRARASMAPAEAVEAALRGARTRLGTVEEHLARIAAEDQTAGPIDQKPGRERR